jgi:hypothetical protein
LPDFDTLFAEIRARYDTLPARADARTDFVAHLRSLARFIDEPMDNPRPATVAFPAEMAVAYAVCHPEWGAAQLIVDGSTQECQRCGGSHYRTEVRTYALAPTGTGERGVAATKRALELSRALSTAGAPRPLFDMPLQLNLRR